MILLGEYVFHVCGIVKLCPFCANAWLIMCYALPFLLQFWTDLFAQLAGFLFCTLGVALLLLIENGLVLHFVVEEYFELLLVLLAQFACEAGDNSVSDVNCAKSTI